MVKYGTVAEDKQRYRHRACPERGRTFLLAYTYAGQSPAIKRQIVDMAMNASGIHDTARVLHKKGTSASAHDSGGVQAFPSRAGRGRDLSRRQVDTAPRADLRDR